MALFFKNYIHKKETSLDSPVFNPSLQNTELESRDEISCDHVDNKCTNVKINRTIQFKINSY
jgi:hypothetical protein